MLYSGSLDKQRVNLIMSAFLYGFPSEIVRQFRTDIPIVKDLTVMQVLIGISKSTGGNNLLLIRSVY